MTHNLKELCGKRAYARIKCALSEKQTVVVTGKTNTGKSMCLRAIVAKLPVHLTIMTDGDIKSLYPARNILELSEGFLLKALPDTLDGAVIVADDVTESSILGLFSGSKAQVILGMQELSDDLAEKLVGRTNTVLLLEMSLSKAGRRYISKVVEIESSVTGLVRTTVCERLI